MILINNEIVTKTINEAKNSPRKRKNHNFHKSLDANVQRMLNAIEPETYVQPHKHEVPDKMEVFIALKGKILVIEFDNIGNITDFMVISSEGDNYGIEIEPRTWHSIISLESGSVVYEIKDGPYSPIDDKNFAPWAPKEGDPRCVEYNRELVKKCGL
jgi:cupin fold WbuC family metalloprotein